MININDHFILFYYKAQRIRSKRVILLIYLILESFKVRELNLII